MAITVPYPMQEVGNQEKSNRQMAPRAASARETHGLWQHFFAVLEIPDRRYWIFYLNLTRRLIAVAQNCNVKRISLEKIVELALRMNYNRKGIKNKIIWRYIYYAESSPDS